MSKPKAKGVAAAAAKSLQLCLTLCNPMDGSPPGSPVPGKKGLGVQKFLSIIQKIHKCLNIFAKILHYVGLNCLLFNDYVNVMCDSEIFENLHSKKHHVILYNFREKKCN